MQIVDGRQFGVLITVITIYALFGDDIRLWLTEKESDDVFFGLSAVAFVLFAFELIVNSVARPGFANPPSFFFWLDLLATLSLLPDIGWVWDPIEALFEGGASGNDVSSQIRAGRAARAGTRAGRVVRVVRLIRLVRVFKLYKQCVRARQARQAALKAASTPALEDQTGTPRSMLAGGTDMSAGGGGTPRKARSGGAVLANASEGGKRLRMLVPSKRAASVAPATFQGDDRGDGRAAAGEGGMAAAKRGPGVASATAPAGHLAAGTDTGASQASKAGESMYGDDDGSDATWVATSPMPKTALDAAMAEREEMEDEDESPEAGGTKARKISNVGMVLSDLTIRRVILLILIMLFVVPFLSNVEQSAYEQIRGGLAELHRYPQDVNVSQETFRFGLQSFARHAGRVIYVAVCPPSSTGCRHRWPVSVLHGWLADLRFDGAGDTPVDSNGAAVASGGGSGTQPVTGWSASMLLDTEQAVLAKFRGVELSGFTQAGCYGPDDAGVQATDPRRGTCESVLWLDVSVVSREEALLSFIRTWFVIFVIAGGAALFTRDAELLVIRPIERMTALMTKLAADPLKEIQQLRRDVLRDAYDSDDDDDDDEAGAGAHRGLDRVDTVSEEGAEVGDGDGEHAVAVESHEMGGIVPMSRGSGDHGSDDGTTAHIVAAGATVPRLPVGGVRAAGDATRGRHTPRDSEEGDASARGSPSRSRAKSAARVSFTGGRKRSARGLESRSRSAGRSHAISMLASRRHILADVNPVKSAGGMQEASRSMRGKSMHRISQGRPGPAGAEGSKGGASGPRAPERSAGQTAAACARSAGRYACTSLVNLFGGSPEDASARAEGSYETAQLENAMIKIGGLVQVGFGEAGADIIAKNMGQGKGKLNPLVRGRRVDAIFGFCDIRQFTDATECLQEEVMVFVNTVGHIVHSATHRLGGAANKNIGDAFLLTWKLPRLLDPKQTKAKSRELLVRVGATERTGRRMSMEAFADALTRPDGSASLFGQATRSWAENGDLVRSQGMWADDQFSSTARVPFGRRSAKGGSSTTMPKGSSPRPGAGAGGAGTPKGAATTSGGILRVPQPPSSPIGRRFHSRHDSHGQAIKEVDEDAEGHSPRGADGRASAAAADDGAAAADGAPVSSRHPPPSSTNAAGESRSGSLDASGSSAAGGLAAKAAGSSHPPVRFRIGQLDRHSASSGGPGSAGDSKQAVKASGAAGSAGGAAASASTPVEPLGAWLGRPETLGKTGHAPALGSRNVGRTVSQGSAVSAGQAGGGVAPGSASGAGSSSSPRGASPRRRASMPGTKELKTARRHVMTRPSLIMPEAHKELQHNLGVTIVDDPVGAGTGGGAGFRPDTIRMRDRVETARTADNALAAFLKVIVDIRIANRPGGKLYPFRSHKAIRAAFGDGFRVRLGFGLHLGWAVEGAVGSSYKVDASYLSPHVNLSARLEALTKFYGVPLLISGPFARELSLDAQRYLRLIDRVTVKGSRVPIELYTFDIAKTPTSLGELKVNVEPRTDEERLANKMLQEPAIHIDFANDPGILKLQEGIPDAFFASFHAGVRAYIRGEWEEARDVLRDSVERYGMHGDGPTEALLKTMRKLSGSDDGPAPEDWANVHVLDSKTG